jgi:hypothetical protein
LAYHIHGCIDCCAYSCVSLSRVLKQITGIVLTSAWRLG